MSLFLNELSIPQISVAALAVALRSYVTYLKRTKTQEACGRVTEIFLRWQSAQRYLGPIIEAIPQILIVSIMLFVAGLIDNLFAVANQLQGQSASLLLLTAKLCTFVFTLVIAALLLTTVHAALKPHTSPFRSKVATLMSDAMQSVRTYIEAIVESASPAFKFHPPFNHSNAVIPQGKGTASRIAHWVRRRYQRYKASLERLRSFSLEDDPKKISPSNILAYYSILSSTYDDEMLDDASSALSKILDNVSSSLGLTLARDRNQMVELLEYLLSPRASRRSVVTAANAIYSCQNASSRFHGTVRKKLTNWL
jgi:hypothetical protein